MLCYVYRSTSTSLLRNAEQETVVTIDWQFVLRPNIHMRPSNHIALDCQHNQHITFYIAAAFNQHCSSYHSDLFDFRSDYTIILEMQKNESYLLKIYLSQCYPCIH